MITYRDDPRLLIRRRLGVSRSPSPALAKANRRRRPVRLTTTTTTTTTIPNPRSPPSSSILRPLRRPEPSATFYLFFLGGLRTAGADARPASRASAQGWRRRPAGFLRGPFPPGGWVPSGIPPGRRAPSRERAPGEGRGEIMIINKEPLLFCSRK